MVCQKCRSPPPACLVCTKKVSRHHAKLKCEGCKSQVHARCGQGVWTEEGCPSPACNLRPMHPSIYKASTCYHCHSPTASDTGAIQCPGCLRDSCSSHIRDRVISCRQCSSECKHKHTTGKCHKCRHWWNNPTPPPIASNRTKKRRAPRT